MPFLCIGEHRWRILILLFVEYVSLRLLRACFPPFLKIGLYARNFLPLLIFPQGWSSRPGKSSSASSHSFLMNAFISIKNFTLASDEKERFTKVFGWALLGKAWIIFYRQVATQQGKYLGRLFGKHNVDPKCAGMFYWPHDRQSQKASAMIADNIILYCHLQESTFGSGLSHDLAQQIRIPVYGLKCHPRLSIRLKL